MTRMGPRNSYSRKSRLMLPQTRAHVSFANVIEERHNDAFPNALGRFVNAVRVGAGRLSGENIVAGENGAHAGSTQTEDAALLLHTDISRILGIISSGFSRGLRPSMPGKS